MLLAGDELGNSQGGNNNAYCQDNETGWVNWGEADTSLLDFVAALSAFRAGACLAAPDAVSCTERCGRATGCRMSPGPILAAARLQWRDPGLSNICLTLRCSAEAPHTCSDDDAVFVAFNRSDREMSVTLPVTPSGWHWVRGIDTSKVAQGGGRVEAAKAQIAAHTVVAFVCKEDGGGA